MDSEVGEFYKLNNNKRRNGLASAGPNQDSSVVDRAIRNASRAVCGVFEKETRVKTANVPKIIKGLQRRGYNVIGTSHERPGALTKKIWFITQGLGSL